jgi:hypothetical protein
MVPTRSFQGMFWPISSLISSEGFALLAGFILGILFGPEDGGDMFLSQTSEFFRTTHLEERTPLVNSVRTSDLT